MSKVKETASKRSKQSDAKWDLSLSDLGQVLLEQYGCGPIQFSGTDDALYERHLLFDDIVAPSAAGPREQFEAAARSVRDVLSQRWVHDRKHLRPREPEADLLPVDGISDRALADQQYHQPSARSLREANCRAEERRLARPASKKNPTPASETAGSGAWRLAFSTRWRRCNCRRWAMGCVTNTASSNRPSKTAGSMNSRTTGCVGRIPGRSLVPTRRSKSNSTALSRWLVDNCAPYPAGPPR